METVSDADTGPTITRDILYAAIERLDHPLHQTTARLRCTGDGPLTSLRLDYRVPLWIFVTITAALMAFGALVVWAIHAGGAVPPRFIQPFTWIIVAFTLSVPALLVAINQRNIRRSRRAPALLEHHTASGMLRMRDKPCSLHDPTIVLCKAPLLLRRSGGTAESPSAILAIADETTLLPLVMLSSGLTDFRARDKDAVAQFAVASDYLVFFTGVAPLDAKQLRPYLDTSWFN